MKDKRIDILHDDYMPYYQDLANAIVAQAARDYRDVMIELQNPRLSQRERYVLIKQRKELLQFLNDQNPWYSMLTKVDPVYIIEQIEKEIGL